MKLVIQLDSENFDQMFLADVINRMVGSVHIDVLQIEPETSMETEIRDYLSAEAMSRYSE